MCLSCLQYGIYFGNKKPDNVDRDYIVLLSNLIEEGTVQCISGVARSSYRQHSCDDVTKLGLCDWFTNELTDWRRRRRRRRRRKEITYETLGLHLVQKL